MLSWFLLVLLLGGCLGFDFQNAKTGKVGPSWDVPVSIPLIHGYRVELKEALGDVDGIEVDEKGAYSFRFDAGDPVEFTVGEIELSPIDIAAHVGFDEIGGVRMPNLIDKGATVKNVPGDTMGRQQVGGVSLVLGDFDSITFAADSASLITVQVSDGGGFAPASAISYLEVILMNGGDVVARFELVSAESPWDLSVDPPRIEQFNVAGLTLPSQVEIEVELEAAGGGASQGDLGIHFKLPEAYLVGAEEITIIEEDAVKVSFDVDVSLADAASGFVAMEVATGALELLLTPPDDSNIDFKIDNLLLDGDPLIAGGGEYDLAGKWISASPKLTVHLLLFGTDLSFDDESVFEVTGHLRQPGGGGKGITLASVTGKFAEAEVIELDPETIPLEWPSEFSELLDRLQLGDVTLGLVIENGTEFVGDLSDLTLTADIGGKSTEVTGVWKDELVAPGKAGAPKKTTISIGKSNSNILDILNKRADSFTIGGKLALSSADDDITVSATDGFAVTFELVALMSVVIPKGGAELVKVEEPIEIEFDASQSDLIRKAFKEQRLYVDVVNHMPIGLELTLFLSDQPDPYSDPGAVRVSSAADAADVDPNGLVIAPVKSSMLFGLDESDFEIFRNSPVYLGARVFIPNEMDKEVTATLGSEDYLEIDAYATFTVRVNQ